MKSVALILLAGVVGGLMVVPAGYCQTSAAEDYQSECSEHSYAVLVSGRHGRPMGNIAPYRTDMIKRIAGGLPANLPGEASATIVVLTVENDGTAKCCEVILSSGNKSTDAKVTAAILRTKFAPLPKWYHGEELQFKVSMSKVFAQVRPTKPAVLAHPREGKIGAGHAVTKAALK